MNIRESCLGGLTVLVVAILCLCLVVPLAIGAVVSGRLGDLLVTGPAAELRGTVTSATPLLMPADGFIVVELYDVGDLGSDPATWRLVASERYGVAGRQLPIAFSLPYNPRDLRLGNVTGVVGHVEDANGRVLYRAPLPVPVITQGFPTEGVQLVVGRAS